MPGAMGAAEPLRSVLWVKRQRCAVSLDPARALLRWWRSPGPGADTPGAGECRRPPAGSTGVTSALLRAGQGEGRGGGPGRSEAEAGPGSRRCLGGPRAGRAAPEGRIGGRAAQGPSAGGEAPPGPRCSGGRARVRLKGTIWTRPVRMDPQACRRPAHRFSLTQGQMLFFTGVKTEAPLQGEEFLV